MRVWPLYLYLREPLKSKSQKEIGELNGLTKQIKGLKYTHPHLFIPLASKASQNQRLRVDPGSTIESYKENLELVIIWTDVEEPPKKHWPRELNGSDY